MKKIGLNAFYIKLLMAAFMVLDHLHFVHGLVTPVTASFFTLISRCVAPMFAYLAVEGIRHTGDLKKYGQRLALWAGAMFIGNITLNRVFLLFAGALPDSERMYLTIDINNNIFFTLALGVLAISLILWGKEQKKKLFYVMAAACFVVGFLFGEWGTVLLPFMFLEYFFHDKLAIRFLGYGLIEVIAVYLPFGEPYWFFVFLIILLYNGERGPKTAFSKYFFYAFYMVHLWLIYIINFLVMMRA